MGIRPFYPVTNKFFVVSLRKRSFLLRGMEDRLYVEFFFIWVDFKFPWTKNSNTIILHSWDFRIIGIDYSWFQLYIWPLSTQSPDFFFGQRPSLLLLLLSNYQFTDPSVGRRWYQTNINWRDMESKVQTPRPL